MARIFDSARDFDRATGASVEERLVRMERLATLMDAALVVPGTNIRFGADAVIGLIPGAGDLVSAAISSLIVLEARRMGAPGHLVARMVANIAIDGAVGTVPLLGDIFDVAFRANLRNVRLLRKHFEKTDRL